MKILAIDCGNTRIKWGLWDGTAWLRVGAMGHDEMSDATAGIAAAFATVPVPQCVAIANVAGEGARSVIAHALAPLALPVDAPVIWARLKASQCGVKNLYSQPGTLGVDWRRPKTSHDTVILESVHPKSGSEKAGLKAGDVVIALNGQPIGSVVDWAMFMQETPLFAGDTLDFKIRRGEGTGSEEREVQVTLDADEKAMR